MLRPCLFGSLCWAALSLPATAAEAPAPTGSPPAAAPTRATPADGVTRAQVLDTMKKATQFMVDKVAYRGGYVWAYLPDRSRRWGEMEAYPTMIWIQPPGTPAMGHAFLDAYRATKDEYYYQAAQQVAAALIQAQHPSGGWNYAADLESEENLKKWYATVGRNGWRLEEFQHYYGNATFDDNTTVEAARFMLRMFLEKRDPRYQASLEKVIQFVLSSQHPSGGWPQRFPPAGQFSKDGLPDYSSYLTFNDGVATQNMTFLLECHRALGEARLLEPMARGMNFYVLTQQPAPQAGWAMQYTPDLQPAGARSYEPKALSTSTTAANIEKLLEFYALTGDRKFLARIPEALAWLDAVRLPPELARGGGSHPTFVELGTNQPLFIHRTGSNATNGHYFADHNPQNTVGHYSSFRNVDVAGLRARYEHALAAPPPPARAENAPPDPAAPPRAAGARRGGRGPGDTANRAAQVIGALNAEGYWPSPLRSTSHPYQGDGPKAVAAGDFGRANVGDAYDTSPYAGEERVLGISTATYIANLGVLIRYLEANP